MSRIQLISLLTPLLSTAVVVNSRSQWSTGRVAVYKMSNKNPTMKWTASDIQKHYNGLWSTKVYSAFHPTWASSHCQMLNISGCYALTVMKFLETLLSTTLATVNAADNL